MAITTVIQPPFEVTDESEKDTGWPNGSQVFVTSTGKYYILQGASFIDLTSLAAAQGASITSALNYSLT